MQAVLVISSVGASQKRNRKGEKKKYWVILNRCWLSGHIKMRFAEVKLQWQASGRGGEK